MDGAGELGASADRTRSVVLDLKDGEDREALLSLAIAYAMPDDERKTYHEAAVGLENNVSM